MQNINQKKEEQEQLKKTKQATGLEREIQQEQKPEENETFSPSEEGATEEKFQFQQPQSQTTDEDLEAQKKADDLRTKTAEHKKIGQLLSITQEKGADFAIKVAQKAKDPCLLDLFHDTLIQKGIKKAK
ncbi:hypothetical protein COX24_03000 [bacterium (Candidatus Gribaldobacteria) CG23_combo_of_CG06-09_8_20_14_all_37_87_8]|uniref:Uncharacterized protein n=2 Tax=Candidatus Gribaldobacteria TaxID=2798536 RepID=A0A2G9ZEH0_9BACT|nr:MAG: hypothetical protein AUJ25_02165 [Parcubacteria group bacterium CG1_02_37_13]PIP31575.1 MAG: hypothetical protein COX24_03000 [bacterium (Candidatus Gribaldobacteria) CG23_combo_of_CG06-09_8_20_14_all_37_87_8]PIR90633.1 MAG: hypothetical protein COU05_01045 [bacterium (Candidatus Gribaldobacteria) CG10_big_fil_rev_8_21_14_0_10_37_21]